MECQVCFEVFDEQAHKPLFLTCGHTFCKLCLTDLEQGRQSIICPMCNSVISLANIDSLPINYTLMKVSSSDDKPQKQESQITCPQHPNKKAKFFCENCKQPICSECFIVHKSHDILQLQEYLAKISEVLYRRTQNLILCLSTRQTEITSMTEKSASNMSELKQELEASYAAVIASVNREYHEMMQAIDHSIRVNTERSDDILRKNRLMYDTASELSRSVLGLVQNGEIRQAQLDEAQHIEAVLGNFGVNEDKFSHIFGTIDHYGRNGGAYLGKLDLTSQEISLSALFEPFSNSLGKPGAFNDSQSTFSDEGKQPTGGSRMFSTNAGISSERTSTEEVKQVSRKSYQPRMKKPDRMSGNSSNVRWNYMTNARIFRNYKPEDSRLIEEAFSNGIEQVELPKYIVDLRKMVQVNKKTHKSRPIQREVLLS